MTKTILTLILGFVCGDAHAAGLEAKTMRDTLSARPVDRPLLIGKGWLEVGIGGDVKLADGKWSPEGEAVDFESAGWTYSTQRVDVRYGIARRAEFFYQIKTHRAHLENSELGTDSAFSAIGDPHFGYRFLLSEGVAPMTSVIFEADYKAPLGNEAPGNAIGGATTFENVITSTGTPDLDLGVRAKKQFGPASVEGGVSYMRRFSALAQYAFESKYSQFSTRIKPGDQTRFYGEALMQLGPLAVTSGAVLTLRQDTSIGATQDGLFPGGGLDDIEGSSGWALDGNLGATFSATRGIDFLANVNVPLRGEDLMFFPIEDLHPTRGNTYGGSFLFRY